MKQLFIEIFGALFVVLMAMVLSIFLVILFTAFGLSRQYALIGFDIGFICLMYFGYLICQKKYNSENIKITKSGGLSFLVVLLYTFVVVLMIFIIVGLFNAEIPLFRWRFDVDSLALAATLLNLVTLEEILFRGFLYRAIERSWGFNVAIYVSSIVFTLFHIHGGNSIVDYIYYFSGGVVAASLVHITERFASAIAFHFSVNVLSGSPFTKEIFHSAGIGYAPLIEFSTIQSNQMVATLGRLFIFFAAVYFIGKLHAKNMRIEFVK